MSTYWWILLTALGLLFNGLIMLITGDGGRYWGFPVSAWGGWIFTPIGLYLLIFSIRALCRAKTQPGSEPAPPVELDEDATPENGEPPEKSSDKH